MSSQLENDPSRLSRRSFIELSGKAAALLAAGDVLTRAGRAYPQETGKKVRLGVVGGGFGATFHWHQHPNCVVTGVTDLYPARRDRLKDYYKCDAVYESLEAMIRDAKDIDAVAVFSGATDHAKHVRMCFDRGWHVVSAVPACTSLDEAAMLKEQKERTGLRYMLAESSWYRQECIFARNLYKEGGFGELFYTEGEYYHDRGSLEQMEQMLAQKSGLPHNPDGSRSWRFGYPPMLYPTHSVGFLVGVTGERVVKVSCLGWRGTRPELRESPFMTENVYGNPFWSQSSLMLTDRGHMARMNEFRRCTVHGERAQWFGDDATFYMAVSGLHGNTVSIRGKGVEAVAVPQYWQSDMLPEAMRVPSGHGGSAVFISAEFVNALLEDREPEIDLYEALAMNVPGIVANESSLKDGEQLSVPQFDRRG
ncbi:MAG: Gfo/Idh/MocA family oxidoreductase [Thermoguttaceae bacterium]|jgi:predicted dehydrogenase|nr:Gfo/Idh/MocA family oxidoreductase [Thermoguttaceae bacterium]